MIGDDLRRYHLDYKQLCAYADPEVAGSNPVPTTRKARYLNEKSLRCRALFCLQWLEGPEKGPLVSEIL